MFLRTLRSCCIGINRFNHERYWLERLMLPNRTLFQRFRLKQGDYWDSKNSPFSRFARFEEPAEPAPSSKCARNDSSQPKMVFLPIEHEIPQSTQPTEIGWSQ